MDIEILPLISRLLHIASAIALAGGTAFLLIGLLPAVKLLDRELADSIVSMAARKYYKVSHLAAFLLVVTGFYNFFLNRDVYNVSEHRALIHPLIGTKILLGCVIVTIVFLAAFRVLPGPPTKWAKLNLVLAIIVVILASLVRQLRLTV
jgi:hypothetical protein